MTMTNKDWIIISLVSLGAFLLTRKVFGESPSMLNPEIPLSLKNANPALLPIATTLNADELRVMQYADIMMYEGQKQGIAPDVIAAIIRAESSGIATATAYESAVKSYSYGLMQLLLETATWLKDLNSWLKYNKNPQTLLIPDVNIEIGTSYLAFQYKRYKKATFINPITDMIASYNAGSVPKGTAAQNDYTYTNSNGDPKVQAYVDKVMLYKSRFRMMFEYLYSNYNDLFPASIWGR